MSRLELAAILADLVRAKSLTRAEADRVLAAYDADQLDVDNLVDVPESDNNDWLAALALLLLLLRGTTRRRLSTQRRERGRRLLRSNFDRSVDQLASTVTQGNMPMWVWQVSMQSALSTYMRQMAIAGAGRLPSVAMRQTVDRRLGEQWPFLRRFATLQVARNMVERPMSERAIASRSRSYGASAWGAFFQAQGDGAGEGYVEQYITRDDRFVCRLCAPRHLQYYLPGQPPFPGDCLGVCRCVRQLIFAPDIYAQLTGQPQRRAA